MKGRISRFLSGLLGNKGIKLVALVLAVISWYAIREEISFEKDVTDIPIRILVDEGYALFDLDPSEATVRLQGPEGSVWNLNRENVRIQVDIRGRSGEGTLRIPFEAAHVQTPAGVRTADIQPSHVFLSVDEVAETNVLVRANIEGELPQGFEVEAVVCRPATVRLSGPRQGLAEIKEISTAPIDLAGRLGSFELPVALETPGVRWEARVNPTFVNVAVTVAERSAVRTLDDIPVKVVIGAGRAVDVTLVPETVSVVIAGRAEKLDALDPEGMFAYVDCRDLDAGGSYELPVQVHAPGNLAVQEVMPQSVKATLGTP